MYVDSSAIIQVGNASRCLLCWSPLHRFVGLPCLLRCSFWVKGIPWSLSVHIHQFQTRHVRYWEGPGKQGICCGSRGRISISFWGLCSGQATIAIRCRPVAMTSVLDIWGTVGDYTVLLDPSLHPIIMEGLCEIVYLIVKLLRKDWPVDLVLWV